MTLNLSDSNKQSNYYLTQIDEIRDLNEITPTQVDNIQTDVDKYQHLLQLVLQVNHKLLLMLLL